MSSGPNLSQILIVQSDLPQTEDTTQAPDQVALQRKGPRSQVSSAVTSVLSWWVQSVDYLRKVKLPPSGSGPKLGSGLIPGARIDTEIGLDKGVLLRTNVAGVERQTTQARLVPEQTKYLS